MALILDRPGPLVSVNELQRIEGAMDARKVAAQFAAYTWYEAVRTGQVTEREKTRFARQNWQAFVPVASQGLGRLLTRIARGRRPAARRSNEAPRLAVVG